MSASVRHSPPDECAQCGESIPRNAHACPSCGADERTGWCEVSLYDGLDLPDDESAESAATSRPHRSRHSQGLAWYWVATLIGLLIVLGLGAFGLLR
jgi:predicted nucleic acid-binding Zn ribbon protein